MSFQLKLDEIESLHPLQLGAVSRLLELSNDSDPEVRLRAIERLKGSENIHVLRRVRDALYDSDDLVRIASLEFLGESNDTEALETIKTCLGDSDKQVRVYAALALGKLGDAHIISELEFRSSGTSDEEKVAYYSALLRLGREEYLERMLALLRSESYQARSMAANLLVDHADSGARKVRILRALGEAAKEETTVAARSSMQSAISEIETHMHEIGGDNT